MPAITKITPFAGPLAYSDFLLGVFGGATYNVTLQQFRDFFGVGTNIKYLPQYPADPSLPEYGKNGDVIWVTTTNRYYQKVNGLFPPVNAPTGIAEGTRVNDAVVSSETSWSSQQIVSYNSASVSAALNFRTGSMTLTVPFFVKVLLAELKITLGNDSFAARLVLSTGTEVITASGTGAACIGTLSASIVNLTGAQVAAGYNVELTYTGTGATAVGLLRTLPA